MNANLNTNLNSANVLYNNANANTIKHSLISNYAYASNANILNSKEAIINNTKRKKFLPSNLVIEESSSIFIKWLSSILQFIKDFEIADVK